MTAGNLWIGLWEEEDFIEVYTKVRRSVKVFPDGRIAHYNELPAPGQNWLSGQDFIYSKN